MLLTNERKPSRHRTAKGAKPRWDNSDDADKVAPAKLFIVALIHGVIMIGIGWMIVRFLMQS